MTQSRQDRPARTHQARKRVGPLGRACIAANRDLESRLLEKEWATVSDAVDEVSGPAGLAAELTEIALHCARLPVISTMTDDEILGYDEFGIPTR